MRDGAPHRPHRADLNALSSSRSPGDPRRPSVTQKVVDHLPPVTRVSYDAPSPSK
jgi:hypothetical protein